MRKPTRCSGPPAIPAPIMTAQRGWATTFIRAASWRSTQPPENSSGISSSRRTMCTTGMPRKRPSSSTPQFRGRPRKLHHPRRPQCVLLRARSRDRRVPSRQGVRVPNLGERELTTKGRPIVMPKHGPDSQGHIRMPRRYRRHELGRAIVGSANWPVLCAGSRRMRELHPRNHQAEGRRSLHRGRPAGGSQARCARSRPRHRPANRRRSLEFSHARRIGGCGCSRHRGWRSVFAADPKAVSLRSTPAPERHSGTIKPGAQSRARPSRTRWTVSSTSRSREIRRCSCSRCLESGIIERRLPQPRPPHGPGRLIRR